MCVFLIAVHQGLGWVGKGDRRPSVAQWPVVPAGTAMPSQAGAALGGDGGGVLDLTAFVLLFISPC